MSGQLASPTRSVLILLSVSVLLASALAVAVGLGISRAVPGGSQQSNPCPAELVSTLQAAEVSVNIYNATSTSGLAASTSKQLKKLGIRVLSVGNKPAPSTNARQRYTVILVGSSAQLRTLATLQSYFSQAGVLLKTSQQTGVDIYLIGTKPVIRQGQEQLKLQCLTSGVSESS